MYDCSAYFTSDSITVCLAGVPRWRFALLIWTRTSETGDAILCRWRHLKVKKKYERSLTMTLESLAHAQNWRGDQEIIMFDGPFIQWSSSSELIDPLSMEVDVTNHDLVAFKFWVGPVIDRKDSFLLCPWRRLFSHKQKKYLLWEKMHASIRKHAKYTTKHINYACFDACLLCLRISLNASLCMSPISQSHDSDPRTLIPTTFSHIDSANMTCLSSKLASERRRKGILSVFELDLLGSSYWHNHL